MLQVQNVSHSFSDTDISYPNWEVSPNGQALILGNSGCGKTTLLHLITGLLKPSKGSISIGESEITNMSQGQLDIFRAKNIGIVFQKPHLIQSLTVEENIGLALRLSGSKSKGNIDDLLESLDLSALRKKKVYQISEGQAQRVSIARAVVNEPNLLAADEPTASLDDENCKRVIDLLKEQASQTDAMLIIATHDHRVKQEFSNCLEL